jgi:hypothetical protein
VPYNGRHSRPALSLKRSRNTIGPLIGYHGRDRSVAEAVLSGRRKLQPSQNDYDWLGPGIYFWVDSPERGLNWAREQRVPGQPTQPAINAITRRNELGGLGFRLAPWIPVM